MAALNPLPDETPEAKIARLEAQLSAMRAARINSTVALLVQEHRLTPEEAPRAIARATADDSYLIELQMRPSFVPAPTPRGIAKCPQ